MVTRVVVIPKVAHADNSGATIPHASRIKKAKLTTVGKFDEKGPIIPIRMPARRGQTVPRYEFDQDTPLHFALRS